MREVDRKLILFSNLAGRPSEPRASGKVQHENETMLRQLVMALFVGWEDLKDDMRPAGRLLVYSLSFA